MSDATSAGWSESRGATTSRRRTATVLLEAVLVGLLAGMGAFAYNRVQFVTLGVSHTLLLVPVAAAGVFAHLFTSTLRRSIRLALAGFFVGMVTLVLAWIAPLVVLPYPPGAREALLLLFVREAMTAAFINYSPAYLGAYLLAVSVTALWE